MESCHSVKLHVFSDDASEELKYEFFSAHNCQKTVGELVTVIIIFLQILLFLLIYVLKLSSNVSRKILDTFKNKTYLDRIKINI